MRFPQFIAVTGLALMCAFVPALAEEKPICYGREVTAYVLQVKHFDVTEVSRLEEAFINFSCYERHRVLPSEPEMIDYRYLNSMDLSRLVRALRFALEHMNIPGTVSVKSDKVIIVEKSPQPLRVSARATLL